MLKIGGEQAQKVRVERQCFFCDGTSRYGIPENLTTG